MQMRDNRKPVSAMFPDAYTNAEAWNGLAKNNLYTYILLYISIYVSITVFAYSEFKPPIGTKVIDFMLSNSTHSTYKRSMCTNTNTKSW